MTGELGDRRKVVCFDLNKLTFRLTIVNTGPDQITTGDVSYKFQSVSDDTKYDAIGQPFDNKSCNNQDIKLGKKNACTLTVSFPILDHDPFDVINPPDDVGVWIISAFVNDADGHVFIAVTDQPEPASFLLLLVPTGVLLWRRRSGLSGDLMTRRKKS